MIDMIYPFTIMFKKYGYYLLVLSVIMLSFLIYFSSYSFFGFRFFSVQTGSMSPALNVGDLILVHKQDKYNLDDIVTLEKEQIGIQEEGNKFLTHRVVEVKSSSDLENEYHIQGDQNTKPDQFIISNKAIVGKVIKRFAMFGNIVDYLKTDEGMAIFIFTPTAFIIFSELQKIKQAIKQTRLTKKIKL